MTERPDPVAYMHQVAASPAGRAYKQAVLAAADLRAGQVVLELGCGPGADLAALTTAVGPTGQVLAVDVDPAMAAAARQRIAGLPGVGVLVGDAHALPLPDASVDRAHADRVFQHLRDPARAMSQIRRVLRPGGLAALVEPDWATLAIAARDLDASQAFTDHTVARVVRNSRIGRQLPRSGTAAGLQVVSVTPFSVAFTDVEQADVVLGLTRNTHAGISARHMDGPRSRAWLADLADEASGPFLAVVTLIGVVLQAPA